MTTPTPSPRTAAGRALLAEADFHDPACPRWSDVGNPKAPCSCSLPKAVEAIEAEATAAPAGGLRTDLLAQAIHNIADWEAEDWLAALDKGDETDAVAAEYARLLGSAPASPSAAPLLDPIRFAVSFATHAYSGYRKDCESCDALAERAQAAYSEEGAG